MDQEIETPSRLPLVCGVILLVAGWVVIGLGWWQAGRQDLETGQIPYVISGGFGGFALILMGIIAILADVVRQAESKLRRSADELHRRMEELAEVFVREQAPEPRPAKSAKRRRSV
jgi:hypothetical protein